MLGGRVLDEAAAVHHQDTLGDSRQECQVVGDPDDTHARLSLQALDKADDFSLHGDIEGGSGLVGDEDARLTGECHGNRHTLSHAAGELVWVLAESQGRIRNTNSRQELLGAPVGLGLRDGEMAADHFRNLPAYGQNWVEGRERVLEDNRDLSATDGVELRRGQTQQFASVKSGVDRPRLRAIG
jgi:hypothetical protein